VLDKGGEAQELGGRRGDILLPSKGRWLGSSHPAVDQRKNLPLKKRGPALVGNVAVPEKCTQDRGGNVARRERKVTHGSGGGSERLIVSRGGAYQKKGGELLKFSKGYLALKGGGKSSCPVKSATDDRRA